ncbi:MAG: hypothetical protein ABIA66_01435 [Candidatus Omnitrophota bacterium]
MRGKRAKLLRKKLAKEYPALHRMYGSRLNTFGNLFRQVKRAYRITGLT